MKKGDVVTIYDDPITKQKPEGQARLLKKLHDNPGQEYWQVKLIKYNAVVERWIATA